MSLERDYQASLIPKIKDKFPNSIVLKNDSSYIAGIPDLILLFGDKWVALECKKSKNAKHQPNQDYYVSKMNEMSYAAFIYPENEQEVFDEIQRALGSSG